MSGETLTTLTASGVWSVTGGSVRGATHLRSGSPNQDSILFSPDSMKGPPIFLALSDGHGSPASFRSHVGSRFAVQVAIEVLEDTWLGIKQNANGNLSLVRRNVEERLAQTIVRSWRQKVQRHLAVNPITFEDWRQLEEKSKGDAFVQKHIQENPFLLYGATLLGVLVGDTFVIYVQLGDGDILVVAEDGQVWRPIPKDPKLFANETTSLCASSSEIDFHVAFETIAQPGPSLIMVSTDGYSNAFCNDEGFLKAGPDILSLFRTEGLKSIENQIESWLNDASTQGSGDDVTMGLVVFENPPKLLKATDKGLLAVGHDEEICAVTAAADSLPTVEQELGGVEGKKQLQDEAPKPTEPPVTTALSNLKP